MKKTFTYAKGPLQPARSIGYRSALAGLLSLVLYCLSIANLMAQPAKAWDKTLGGSDTEVLYSLQQTVDGGYILGGYSSSGAGGDKTQPSQGSSDYWVVKLNADGSKAWDKTLGGSGEDRLQSLQQTADGGYILGGGSSSGVGGDKTQPNRGDADYWVVKLNADGSKAWDKTLSGSDTDFLNSLQQTADGGYILGGYSSSGAGGDKTQPTQGGADYWVVKLNADGSKAWDKTLGGSGEDRLNSLRQTADGGYILGGFSNSGVGGDKTQPNRGNFDYWVVKLNADGSKAWDKTLGGSDTEVLYSLRQTVDGGYILGGYSFSGAGGDKTQPNQGGPDYWVVKLNADGSKAWDKTLGGSDTEVLNSLRQTVDGGYILGGYSDSGAGGDKTQPSMNGDYWVVKLNADGSKAWDKTLGGTGYEQLLSLQQTADGGYILGGYSRSGAGGDKTQPSRGGDDYWVVKLNADCTSQTFYADADGDTYGDATKTIQACSASPNYVNRPGDCNDADATTYPGATERYDGKDNNCDGQIDNGVTTLRDPENPANAVAGLDYQYYEGSWTTLPDFNALTPTKAGTSGNVAVTVSSRNEQFALRFRGYLNVPTDGQYTFYTASDDGSKLFIGTTEVVNNDGLHGLVEQSGSIGLKAGRHALTVLFLQGGGGREITVSYAGPGLGKQAIPASAYYRLPAGTTPPPPTPGPSGGTGTGLLGEYFNNQTLAAPVGLTRVDPLINFNWGDGAPASSVNADKFSVRWTGQVEAPVSGNYLFSTVSDDGVRLWVNGVPLIDNWTNHANTTDTSLPITLTGGQKYAIRMEYYENSGGAVAQLMWAYPGVGPQAIPQPRLYPPTNGNGSRLAARTMTDEQAVRVFPVPARDEIRIGYKAESAGTLSLQLVNAMAQSVRQVTGEVVEGENLIRMPVGDLNRGLYILSITQGDRHSTRKVLLTE